MAAELNGTDRDAVLVFHGNRVLIEADLEDTKRELFVRLRAQLDGAVDYVDKVKWRFDRLILLLVKFLRSRIDHSPVHGRFAYLAARANGDLPKEAELQLDLHDYLLSIGYSDIERPHVASGRADIYIPQQGYRFVIEVKRTTSPRWSRFSLRPFLRQAAGYQVTDKRLGVLAVLDLSRRPTGSPHFLDCMGVHRRRLGARDVRYVVVMRVPGNRGAPSKQPKARRSNRRRPGTGCSDV